MRDAGRHRYDVGLKSNLSHTRTLTFAGCILLSSGHHHSDMVQQSGLPVLQDIFHLHWSRMNLFTARFVKASLGRTSTKVKCWELLIGTYFEPSYLLVSAALCFCPVHSWFWNFYHPRAQKYWYRPLFQTWIERVSFHTSQETGVHHRHYFADLDGMRSHRTGHIISCPQFTRWFCSSL